jgi:magnesium transporter
VEKELQTIDEFVSIMSHSQPTLVTWLDIGGIHDLKVIEKLGALFHLHPLLLEDIVNTEQRPKREEYGDYTYVVAKMLYTDAKRSLIQAEQISFVLGSHVLLSFQEDGGDVFSPTRDRLRTGKGRIRSLKPDYLLYSLLDAIVDGYFSVLEVLGERTEAIEDRVLTEPDAQTLKSIYSLRRDLLVVRRAVWPVREVAGGLERDETALISPATKTYFRDVYDHTIQAIDTIETLRDIVTAMLDIYLSNLSNRMTAVMKVLTIITTIFMPLTFIAGVYGMNFRHMPELEWPWGYPAVLSGMAIIGLLMVWFFRRRHWL